MEKLLAPVKERYLLRTEILPGDKGQEAEHTSPPPLSLQLQLVQDSLLIPIKWTLRNSINDCLGNVKWYCGVFAFI